MQAQIIRRFGGPEVFEAAEIPAPTPRADEVLVRIEATSINPLDVKIRRDGRQVAPDLPAVLGCDVSGRVVSVGDEVDRFAPGDLVYGFAGGVRGSGGTYAELIAADARLLARRPASLTARESAALPLVTITAFEGFQKAGLGAGQTVLVHGGTGGVGHVAIQIAKALGARVVASVSSDRKAGLARELGADETVDYRTEDVARYVARLTDGRGFDIVFDATGGSDLATSFAGAALNGHVVAIVSGFEADLRPMHAKGLSLHVVFVLVPRLFGIGRERHGAILDRAARFADAGRLKPLVDPRGFGLAQIADAHRYVESGEAVGKVVVDVP